MRTEDLIERLGGEAGRSVRPPGRGLALGLAGGFAVSAGLFLAALGIRPDVAAALGQPAFLSKMAVVTAVGAAALPVVAALGRPGRRVPLEGLAAVAAALLALLVVDLAATPRADWVARTAGNNARACLVFVSLLAAAPLVGILSALRHAAPTRPAAAGAAAGLLAGALGAILYGLHCPDDAPMFVAAWYGTALAATSAAGALAGRLLLRW